MSTAVHGATENIIDTIRGEFNEMPGMKLTSDQFCRLWHLERHVAERAIRSLTNSGFLQKDQDDRYGRVIDAVK
jgi:Fic family protein